MKLSEKIQVKNSKTDYKILRPNLMISCLRVLSENKDQEYPQNIYEVGKVFTLSAKKISEENHLGMALSPSNFTDMKQVVEYIFSFCRIFRHNDYNFSNDVLYRDGKDTLISDL